MGRKIFLILNYLFFVIPAFSQFNDSVFIKSKELEIYNLFLALNNTDDDLQKEKLNNLINNKLDTVLQYEYSFNHSFDSLKHVGIIKSSDNQMRIYTWNLPYNDGSHDYFGYIQYYYPKEQEFILYKLSGNEKLDINKNYSNTNWYGILYYEIVNYQYKGKTYYTLLGFDFNNIFTSKKVIETLYFNNNKELHFGYPHYKVDNKIQHRILFEYSARASMSLKYNQQKGMIIFDHLSPSQPSYVGKFQFYGPDFSYDGLIFQKGVWEIVKDIDIRNDLY